METFEQVLDSSRTNSFSWMYSASIVSGVAILFALCFFQNRWIRLMGTFAVVVIIPILAVDFSFRSIEEKWRIRADWADLHASRMTESDYDALTADGANRTLGPMLYGGLAFIILAGVAVGLSGIRRCFADKTIDKDFHIADRDSLPMNR